MFEKLKGIEHITKEVTLIVKGEKYGFLGTILTRSLKENYHEDSKNSIVGRGTVIGWDARWLPGRICSPK